MISGFASTSHPAIPDGTGRFATGRLDKDFRLERQRLRSSQRQPMDQQASIEGAQGILQGLARIPHLIIRLVSIQ